MQSLYDLPEVVTIFSFPTWSESSLLFFWFSSTMDKLTPLFTPESMPKTCIIPKSVISTRLGIK